MSKKRVNQAVVFIHGMGEQKPMDTLRNFVEAVLPEPKSGEKYFSKPDRMSESFELRKLQDRTQPRTHFFEYYWAHKVQGTTLSHIISWLSSLLLRWPWHIPRHLMPLWTISWILAIGVIVSLLFGVFSGNSANGGNGLMPFTISGVIAAAWAFVQSIIINSLGDAARYLSPHPKNISLRQAIRSDGIKLLRNIHEANNGNKYDRVVVVGHNLGSMIGYDILKHLWEEYHDTYRTPQEHNQDALSRVEEVGESLTSSPGRDNIGNFQTMQTGVWKELRKLGNPWLVTDFITLGSPLVHAALLLARNEEDLRKRQRQRELPTCPPIPEITPEKEKAKKGKYSYRIWEPFMVGKSKVTLKAFHHAAVFGCTRWTNLYFPVHWGIFGDFVGGQLSKWFGRGINDIPVASSRYYRLAQFTPAAHSSYWWKPSNKMKEVNGKKSDSLTALIRALDLDGKEWLDKPLISDNLDDSSKNQYD